MELIDKTEVVAEIERIEYETNYESFTDEVFGKRIVCRKMRDFLNSLKVKEVNLEDELNNWRNKHFHGKRDHNAAGEYLKRSSQLNIAKYFFELGFKAQKGE